MLFSFFTAYLHPKKIVVTFSVIEALTKEIIKGSQEFSVHSIIKSTDDPHDAPITPKEYVLLQNADILIENGLGLEPWLEHMIANTKFKKTRILASAGVVPMRFIKNPDVFDPHAWHNLKYAKTYVKNIADVLIKEDPKRAHLYKKNRDQYLERLEQLHKKIKLLFQGLKNRNVITTHDAFWYFGKEYGIAFWSPLGISTAEEPSSFALAKLVRYIRKHNIKGAFFEAHTNNTLVQKIIQETKIKQGGVLYSDSLKNGDFIETIHHNAHTIYALLK
ncbi:MAG: zinc ABC transporter substrate-binding protein [Alphaproteobacteria bacterium]|nr:MAG: zinc ABC transporter substrate-binding protein [Alphaproteobacteria bacterium]